METFSRLGRGKTATVRRLVASGSRSFLNCEEAGEANVQEEQGSAGTEKDLVVFSILRESKCHECGEELWSGDFLVMESEHPLCLKCADLDHLVYLARGDAALTRRAKKHSRLSAVVVRFSRSRGRYERQGVLVEEAALQLAEQTCLQDAEQRAAKRERARVRNVDRDSDLARRMTDAIRAIFPGCPKDEAAAIAAHTSRRGSGRVGRTAAGQALEEDALTAGVIAAIRHKHTRYDELLMQGEDRRDARDAVREDVQRVFERWRIG
jgi:hypothetical protein